MTSGIVQQLSKFSTDVKVMRLNGQYGRGFGITCIYNTFKGSGESAAAATVFGISRDAPSQETEQHWLDGATEGSFQVTSLRRRGSVVGWLAEAPTAEGSAQATQSSRSTS